MILLNNFKNLNLRKDFDNKLDNEKKYKKKNIFFDNLYNLMNDKSFKFFYDEYFDTWDNIEVMIMYIKLFDLIQNEYFKKFHKIITNDEMNEYLFKIMNNKVLRKMVVDSFLNYKKNNNKIFEINKIENKKNINHKKSNNFIK